MTSQETQNQHNDQSTRKWQFRLRGLFIVTAVTAVLLGWARALDYEIALVVLLPLAFLA